jgi:hypothetical protein
MHQKMDLLLHSVADPGWLSLIPDPDFLPIPDPGSRHQIPDPDPQTLQSCKLSFHKKIKITQNMTKNITFYNFHLLSYINGESRSTI